MLTFIIVVLAAIVFEYSNGFHDAANAIATVVSTKVLTPRQAIAMAALFNLTGALFGGAVASTIGKGLVDTNVVTMTTVLCALIAAFAWNITTWWVGLPSSSSHALIGGLCGAAIASAHGKWSVLKWDAGSLAESGAADVHVADCRFCSRRADHVFAFRFAAPFSAKNGEFPFRTAPDF